jgi:hypothetical protein
MNLVEPETGLAEEKREYSIKLLHSEEEEVK